MKINREDLLGTLNQIKPGTSPKETISQSDCFVFNGKEVLSFNDEVCCRMASPLEGIQGAIRAAPLLGILEKLTDDEVEISKDESHLQIKGKGRKARLIMEQDVLLPLDGIELPGKWRDLPEEFEDAVRIVSGCAAYSNSDFARTCIHIHSKYLEACDDHQAARYTVDTGIKKDYLVLRGSIRQILSLGMIKISESENWVHFQNARGLSLSCRRILDDYLVLDNMLVSQGGERVVMPKGIAEAVEIANVLTEGTPDSALIVTLSRDRIKVKGEGPAGEFTEIRKAAYKGREMQFLINAKILQDVVSKHNECTVSEDRLLIDGGSWKYVTALARQDSSNE